MRQPDETFDIVNERDEVIGRAARAEVHARGLKHRAVHVLVFNESAELFVQKRAATKDTFPGRYDSSASGHLASGEGYDECALRELQEELGLEIKPGQLDRRFKIEACSETGCEFVWVYSAHGGFRPAVNPAEIAEGAFWTVDAVRHLVVAHPEQCAPSFCRVFTEFDTRGLFPPASSC
jgi:isopentenyldiphosphate isomerase